MDILWTVFVVQLALVAADYTYMDNNKREDELIVLPPGPVPRASLRQIFRDDFNSFDKSRWDLDASAAQGGHNEFQIYTPESRNCYAHGGVMYLRPTLTSDRFGNDFLYHGTLDVKKLYGYCDPTWNNGCYRNAKNDGIMPPIMSCYMKSKVSFKYGKLEIIAKMPKGDWLWPALWLMPKHSHYGGHPRSGEIDIAELLGNTNYGSIGLQRTTASLHFGNDHQHSKQVTNQHWLHGTTYGDDYHKYTMDWTPDHINIYIDDYLILGTPMPSDGLHHHYGLPGSNIWGNSHNAPFDQDFFVIMNVAVGGTGGIFHDGVKNYPHSKPWSNHDSSGVAMQKFWNHREDWYPTWRGEEAAMKVNSVTIWTY